ncbi:Rrf2 family transcriptional regulator [Tolumonas lignilytica]|jgi:Rrf2 family protein|uniref:Rrf2 family transcriptional regulator n=1 Tax=Tolumonas lignilytica TaxID=1283284 RepID=UPI0004653FB6|nr:Rrf2 family transcriptional regulator [Tolumonas lignilytica]
MQLTLFTDYALRTLVFLALQPEQHLSTITEVADRFSISRNHVVKIVHQLGMKGYIETIRGKHGGIRLARVSSEINLGDLIADMENVSCLLDCQREGCRLAPGCRFQSIMRKAMRAFMGVLAEFTLADLVKDEERMCGLLGLNIPVMAVDAV